MDVPEKNKYSDNITDYSNYLDERNDPVEVGDKKVPYSIVLRLNNHWEYIMGFQKWLKENNRLDF